MTKHTTPTTLTDLDVAGIPDVDGVPFAQALANYFEPLTTYEAEHGPFVAKRVIETGELIRLARLRDKAFGRERGVYVDTDEDGNGPYLVVETRNGGYDATCWEDDENCRCGACLQNSAIPNYPGFVRAEHTGGDSRNYFTLPAIPDDAMLSGGFGQDGRLARLADERERVLSGKAVPWFFVPNRPSHSEIRDDYGRPYRHEMFRSPLAQASDALERKDSELTTKREQLAKLREAYENAEAPEAMPEVMYRRKIGVSGRPLRTKERVPVPGFVRALTAYRESLAADREREIITSDLERLAGDESLSEATRAWMTHEAELRRAVDTNPKYAKRDAQNRAERLYQMQMAYFAAPAEMERLERSIASLTKRITELTADVARARERHWQNWPGDDYDVYTAWMHQRVQAELAK